MRERMAKYVSWTSGKRTESNRNIIIQVKSIISVYNYSREVSSAVVVFFCRLVILNLLLLKYFFYRLWSKTAVLVELAAYRKCYPIKICTEMSSVSSFGWLSKFMVMAFANWTYLFGQCLLRFSINEGTVAFLLFVLSMCFLCEMAVANTLN